MYASLPTFVLFSLTLGCHVSPRDRPEPTFVEIAIHDTTDVDVLFVVDNTNSMSEEQNLLVEQFEIFAMELLSPSDTAAQAVESLHVGVISSDMGTSGYSLQTCSNPVSGDNGVLQNEGRPAGCADRYIAGDCDRDECPWLSHSNETPDDGLDVDDPPIWEDFRCIARLGTSGCGFEQPLQSSYTALVDQTRPGRPNDGFLRHDSLLAIIYVTVSDDCSVQDSEMFDPSRDDLGSLCVRCVLDQNEDRLFPISHYHDAFVALRDGDEARVVVAAIAGLPPDGTWSSEELRNIRELNPENPNELLRSCDTDLGAVYPPVRIAELVESFGDRGVLKSICLGDWTDTFTDIARTIQNGLATDCVELPPDVNSSSDCRLVEVMNDDQTCPSANGDLGLDDEGRRICEMPWSISTTEPGCLQGQLRYSGVVVSGELRFECQVRE